MFQWLEKILSSFNEKFNFIDTIVWELKDLDNISILRLNLLLQAHKEEVKQNKW